MTDLEIQKALLAHYEKHLALMPTDIGPEESFKYLQGVFMGIGLCHCARNILGIRIQDSKWIKSNCKRESSFWYSVPFYLDTIEEIKESIQYRIDILRSLIDEHQPNN